jgi:hypothetical protein
MLIVNFKGWTGIFAIEPIPYFDPVRQVSLSEQADVAIMVAKTKRPH